MTAGKGSFNVDSDEIIRHCKDLGFVEAGIAPARGSSHAAELRAWLESAKHGSMAYLERYLEQRLDPRAMVPGAKSIICVADKYADGRPDRREVSPDSHARGRIARYARGRDYHVVVRRRLEQLTGRLAETEPGHVFRVCVDTAPVLEREHAARAGVGRIGKNTLLISRHSGSWLLLGEIITTLDLRPTAASEDQSDPCGTCTRCLDACPTKAISPWSVDASRCISTLTIEHRSAIEPAFFDAIDDWLFGCDICQEVCPHNQPTRRRRRTGVHSAYASRRDSLPLLEILNWSEDDRREAFASSALKRAKLGMMKRNACIVAGNYLRRAWRADLAGRIAEIARDPREEEMVQETARIICRRLKIQDQSSGVAEGPRPSESAD